MRKFRSYLVMLLLLCTLLNITACSFHKSYKVFSDKDRCITMVAGTMRDQIGIVLDNVELVVCNYKGKELCRKVFDKEIVYTEIYEEKALLQFGDNSIEFYSIENNCLQLISAHIFDTTIKETEIFDWRNEEQGVFVLLENGELWRTESENTLENFILMEDHVKTKAYIACHLTYITEDGKIKRNMFGEPWETDSSMDEEVFNDISKIELDRINGKDCIIGYGKDQSYIIDTLETLTVEITINNADREPQYSTKCSLWGILYQENGIWYYEGIAKDYKHLRNRKDRVKFQFSTDQFLHIVAGGVISYDEHEVNIQLINAYDLW